MGTDAVRESAQEDPGLRRQMGPLLLLTAIFFFNFTSRIILAPLMPEVEADLHISHAVAGSLFFLVSSGYFISLIGSGWVAAGLHHRRTIILSAMVLGLALWAIAGSSSLWTLRATLFLLGIATGLYLPSGIATLTTLIGPRHWGKAVAIHELAPNLGFVAAPLMSEMIMAWFSWRAVPVWLGSAAVILALLFVRFGRGGDFAGAPPGMASFKPFFTEPAFWIMVGLFGLGISSTLGIYTMLPLYLVNEQGVDRNFANTLVAFSRVSGLFMALAGGWASDRFGPCRTLKVVFLITGALTVAMGVLNQTGVLIAVFAQPLAAVCFFPAGFAALSRIGPPGSRNIAVSLTVPMAFMIGGGAVPTLIGFMGDVKSFGAGIGLVGCLILGGAVLAHFLSSRLKEPGPEHAARTS